VAGPAVELADTKAVSTLAIVVGRAVESSAARPFVMARLEPIILQLTTTLEVVWVRLE